MNADPDSTQPPPINLTLPPVDQYRWPYIQPLGCLTLLAAQCDNELIDLIALARSGSREKISDSDYEAAADLVRHWKPNTEHEIVSSLNVDDVHFVNSIKQALQQFGRLRDRRHRAIHDAVSLGWDDDHGLLAITVGYPKKKGRATFTIEEVGPEVIAALACEFGELHADLEHCLYMLQKKLESHTP
jgi:hypothetical protein